MFKAWFPLLLVGVSLAALAATPAEEQDLQELSGVLRKAMKSTAGPYYLELDGGTGNFDLRGKVLEGCSEGDRLWVRGKIQTSLYAPVVKDNMPESMPRHWSIFMEVKECAKISQPFQRPRK